MEIKLFKKIKKSKKSKQIRRIGGCETVGVTGCDNLQSYHDICILN